MRGVLGDNYLKRCRVGTTRIGFWSGTQHIEYIFIVEYLCQCFAPGKKLLPVKIEQVGVHVGAVEQRSKMGQPLFGIGESGRIEDQTVGDFTEAHQEWVSQGNIALKVYKYWQIRDE